MHMVDKVWKACKALLQALDVPLLVANLQSKSTWALRTSLVAAWGAASHMLTLHPYMVRTHPLSIECTSCT